MKRLEALELIKRFYNEPVFNVRIGICSPQVTNVDFETAVEEFDRCGKYTTEYMEYVYIYPSDYVKDCLDIQEALSLFNLGPRRVRLNQEGFWT
jgi:hypothetical protein